MVSQYVQIQSCRIVFLSLFTKSFCAKFPISLNLFSLQGPTGLPGLPGLKGEPGPKGEKVTNRFDDYL